MPTLSRQRCLHHPERQAVARCPECGQFFCRECVAEHDDRVLCAGCLKKWAAAQAARRLGEDATHGVNSGVLGPLRRGLRTLWRTGVSASQGLLGLFLVWCCFYFCGRALVAIPARFHDGSAWESLTRLVGFDEPDDDDAEAPGDSAPKPESNQKEAAP